eukprot:scaffold34958_cov63-Phaeocystis_antarctica.AAC.6
MRTIHASWSPDRQPHNVEVVNRAMRDAASALEKMYVVNSFSRGLPRYFDAPQHCVPFSTQACLGPLWNDAFASLCENPDSLMGSGCIDDARRQTAVGVPACLPQDLHFTAKGQIGVGIAFAEILKGRGPGVLGVLARGYSGPVSERPPHGPSVGPESDTYHFRGLRAQSADGRGAHSYTIYTVYTEAGEIRDRAEAESGTRGAHEARGVHITHPCVVTLNQGSPSAV